MTIAKRIKEAAYRRAEGDWEAALIPASIAVDATARREYPRANNNRRYKRFLDKNQELIMLVATEGGLWIPDGGKFHLYCEIEGRKCTCVSDVLYGVVRCGLVHQAELPAGVGLTEERPLRIFIHGTGFFAPTLLIEGLILAVVASPANRDELFPDDIAFRWYGQELPLRDFRGQKDKLMSVLVQGNKRRTQAASVRRQIVPVQ